MKAAIRMANNEVDKIEDLKKRVDDELKKVTNRKEEEEDKRNQIKKL